MQEEYEFCLRCGRKLKNENYRKVGLGKVCLAKSKSEKIQRPLFGGVYADNQNGIDESVSTNTKSV